MHTNRTRTEYVYVANQAAKPDHVGRRDMHRILKRSRVSSRQQTTDNGATGRKRRRNEGNDKWWRSQQQLQAGIGKSELPHHYTSYDPSIAEEEQKRKRKSKAVVEQDNNEIRDRRRGLRSVENLRIISSIRVTTLLLQYTTTILVNVSHIDWCNCPFTNQCKSQIYCKKSSIQYPFTNSKYHPSHSPILLSVTLFVTALTKDLTISNDTYGASFFPAT